MATNEVHNGHNGNAGTGTAQMARPTGNAPSSGTPDIARPGQLQRRNQTWNDPFVTMQKLATEMDAMLESFGFGRTSLLGRRGAGSMSPAAGTTALRTWSPQIEMEERDGNLVISADLPGLNKEDVRLDIENDTLTIQGERKESHEEKREGYYHSERSYGSFSRSIALPEGVDPDTVKANFRNGVLEITMPAPQRQRPRGRQIQVDD